MGLIGGSAEAGVAGVIGGGGLVGGLSQRAGALSDLPLALRGIAANTGVAEQSLSSLVAGLEDLDFTAIEAYRSVGMLAQTRIPQLIAGVSELGKAARNFSVLSVNSVSEVFEGLVGGIVKEEVEVLETQGLLLKVQEGYVKDAASIGKAVTQLTEEEKAVSRLVQVLGKALSVQGLYESALNESGGALRSRRSSRRLR